jgi:hypothetical protein
VRTNSSTPAGKAPLPTAGAKQHEQKKANGELNRRAEHGKKKKRKKRKQKGKRSNEQALKPPGQRD